MDEKCCFMDILGCSILTATHCEDCKFRKTHEEFEQGQVKAFRTLAAKTLTAKKIRKGGTLIMTAVPAIGGNNNGD